MSSTLASKYAPADVEPRINLKWQHANAFHADPSDPGEPYAIMIPPPNVTSALHMGHALNNTLQDVLIRQHRMRGFNTLWMPGTDHAGIATQTVVEKRVLQEEGKRRTDFDRDAFIARIQAWKDEYETRIADQLKAMGCSCDWDRQRFTMDPVCARAVRDAFFRLFRDGLIYRGKRLVNWDPATQTALADDEVEMKDVDGSFWYLRYPVVNEDGDEGQAATPEGAFVTVATTRPETMLGDTAVAVNPRDPRAAALIGKHVRLPIVNRTIPIIADDYVVLPDPDSGDEKAKYSSGFLKITPAHDPNDWEVGQRHGLPAINVMAPDGSISKDHGWPSEEFESGRAAEAEALLGLSREAACRAVVEWFRDHELLAEVRPYRHAVGHSYRSHVPIEPYLSDQWYVKVTDDRLAKAALRAMDQGSDEATKRRSDEGGRREAWEGQLKFYPARYAKTFEVWHENIRDWCISRQLWWGHRIPVWSIDADKVQDVLVNKKLDEIARHHEDAVHRTVSSGDDPNEPRRAYWCLREDIPAVVELLESLGFERDPDVLDTWFSSALWPISTLGWPQEDGNELLARWNPSNALCTAREIITLWVSRMVMFNLYLRNRLPFKDVFIHAMIQDGHGQKMSKSLGNGVDPLDIIHSHGADAMRFTLAAMTTQLQDVRLPVDLVCPFTAETFTPKFVDDGAGHRVAAAIQSCPSDKKRKIVSSYGLAAGKAAPTDQMPLARNTSEKFDLGRNFANKLWNAVRFSLGHLGDDTDDGGTATHDEASLSLSDRWVLSRLAATVQQSDATLEAYEFKPFADRLYDFIWRDFCDWYIEAIKPTVRENAAQKRVLATVLDVMLRLLHPLMPYITEQLWEHLNQVAPQRGVAGAQTPLSSLLVRAPWPKVSPTLIDPQVDAAFDRVQSLVGAVRQIRTTHKVPPRQSVACSARASRQVSDELAAHLSLMQTLMNAEPMRVGPDVSRPDDAAAALVDDVEIYVHGLVDRDEEHRRLDKRLVDVRKNVAALSGRLNNEGYVQRAPAHLVQQTRDQLEAAQKEAEALEAQAAALNQ